MIRALGHFFESLGLSGQRLRGIFLRALMEGRGEEMGHRRTMSFGGKLRPLFALFVSYLFGRHDFTLKSV